MDTYKPLTLVTQTDKQKPLLLPERRQREQDGCAQKGHRRARTVGPKICRVQGGKQLVIFGGPLFSGLLYCNSGPAECTVVVSCVSAHL